jgi:hypothetical protein
MPEHRADDQQPGEPRQQRQHHQQRDQRAPEDHHRRLREEQAHAGQPGGDGIRLAVQDHRDRDHAHRIDQPGE